MSMTESECIESLNGIYPEWCSEKEEYEMAQVAITALEEIQQYRAIGTVSEFQQLKEKATGKKPYYVKYDYNGNPEQVVYNCPNCKGFVLYQHGACSCGQKLDWSEGKE